VTVWQRDAQGRPVKEQLLEGGRTVVKTTTYSYDTKGNLIEHIESENGVTLKTTYKYDNKSRQIEEVRFDAFDVADMRLATVYDEHGNETEVSSYDKDDRMQAISIYKLTYDKQGNWIKKVQNDNERTTGIVDREIEYY
jgi:YD repeat-containing protein